MGKNNSYSVHGDRNWPLSGNVIEKTKVSRYCGKW